MQCSSTAFICTAKQIIACARAAVIVQSGSCAGGGGGGDQRQGGTAAGVLPILECAAHRRQQVSPFSSIHLPHVYCSCARRCLSPLLSSVLSHLVCHRMGCTPAKLPCHACGSGSPQTDATAVIPRQRANDQFNVISRELHSNLGMIFRHFPGTHSGAASSGTHSGAASSLPCKMRSVCSICHFHCILAAKGTVCAKIHSTCYVHHVVKDMPNAHRAACLCTFHYGSRTRTKNNFLLNTWASSRAAIDIV